MSFFKKILLGILIIIILALLSILSFIYFNPAMGEKPSGDRLEKIRTLDYYKKEKFQNLVPTVSGIKDFSKMGQTMKKFFFGFKGDRPSNPLPQKSLDSLFISKNLDLHRITWFGHSAFLLEFGDIKILLDPMLGDVPAPASFLGNSRFNRNLPIQIDELPPIDFVFISHDHYDHLDYGSIQKLKKKTKKFIVPIGVGAHLERWEVSEEKIIEMEWYEEKTIANVHFVCTPARHFSGRSVDDGNKSLWSSWVIKHDKTSLFFSGDGGYFDEFKKIGKQYGPFDLALIECGQYNENWSDIHMMPEQSVQASVDLKAKVMIPIHWGAFQLAIHPWNDPILRASEKARELDVKIISPIIGENIEINGKYSSSEWWLNVD